MILARWLFRLPLNRLVGLMAVFQLILIIIVFVGMSAIFSAGVVGVRFATFCVDLDPQHLPSHQCASQPSKAPNNNHQKQHPKELSSELIFTPQ